MRCFGVAAVNAGEHAVGEEVDSSAPDGLARDVGDINAHPFGRPAQNRCESFFLSFGVGSADFAADRRVVIELFLVPDTLDFICGSGERGERCFAYWKHQELFHRVGLEACRAETVG